ncbi:HAD hydrolase-like protein [Streptomyces bacillaris]|uniref:HAD hydrolase-like protein n=1 Tax=Streptomyces bacillaris TaxID=68179 RepID=UPI0036CFDD1C
MSQGGWMVGDNPETDIDGGRRAGLRTIWIPNGRAWPNRLAAPDHCVPDAETAIALLLASDWEAAGSRRSRDALGRPAELAFGRPMPPALRAARISTGARQEQGHASAQYFLKLTCSITELMVYLRAEHRAAHDHPGISDDFLRRHYRWVSRAARHGFAPSGLTHPHTLNTPTFSPPTSKDDSHVRTQDLGIPLHFHARRRGRSRYGRDRRRGGLRGRIRRGRWLCRAR